MAAFDFSRESLQVIPCLPGVHPPSDGDDLPQDLINAKIVRFGTLTKDLWDAPGIEGGGLIIDYIKAKAGDECPSRVVLGFNELGMWVVYEGAITK